MRDHPLSWIDIYILQSEANYLFSFYVCYKRVQLWQRPSEYNFVSLTGRRIGANKVRAHARLRTRAQVVVTKLGIILSFSFFLPLTFLPERVYLQF